MKRDDRPVYELLIPDALLADLLSALRRHDRIDADRLLTTWSSAQIYDPDVEDESWFFHCLDDSLTDWVRREAVLHVAGGLFEHALCLVEKYRRPHTAADLAALNPTGVRK